MHVVELLQALLLAIHAVRVEAAVPDTIIRVGVNGGRQMKPGEHGAAPGVLLVSGQDRDDLPRASFLQFLEDGAGALGRLRLDQEVKVLRHQNPANQQEARLFSQLAQDFNKQAAQAQTVEKPPAAIDAGSNKLQLAGCEITSGGRHGGVSIPHRDAKRRASLCASHALRQPRILLASDGAGAER